MEVEVEPQLPSVVQPQQRVEVGSSAVPVVALQVVDVVPSSWVVVVVMGWSLPEEDYSIQVVAVAVVVASSVVVIASWVVVAVVTSSVVVVVVVVVAWSQEGYPSYEASAVVAVDCPWAYPFVVAIVAPLQLAVVVASFVVVVVAP